MGTRIGVPFPGRPRADFVFILYPLVLRKCKNKIDTVQLWKVLPPDWAIPVRLPQRTDRTYIMTDKISTGGDVDSYCTKCKLILEHFVVAMVGGAVVKVKCKTCGGIHNFKNTTVARSGAPRSSVKTSKSFIHT